MITLSKEDMEELLDGKSVIVYVEDEYGRDIEVELDSELRRR
ncbi:MAG: hypothetical protein AMQ74_01764 [Candidatus Methanofastidiosum methylothiophilum]|uniref:Uncharacterized protein n=1 Tax=Candidatus Methanofastidiosum methylothiophilum TaxID=1705564 RepID=A0A150IP41_9EURY|nr:MAG: hypothetical protein AMQ74_01764 [Candidatus Methanofastidiosum methylthiophilus]